MASLTAPLENRISWYNMVTDVNTLKVIFYLEKYNPNVPIRDLEENLSIGSDKLVPILKNLLTLELVNFDSTKGYYKLTEHGRLFTNRLHTVVGNDVAKNTEVQQGLCDVARCTVNK